MRCIKHCHKRCISKLLEKSGIKKLLRIGNQFGKYPDREKYMGVVI